MADPEVKIKIKSEADLKAAESAKRAYEDLAKATKAMGGNADVAEAEIKQLDAALKSSEANAVRAAAAQKRIDDATGRSKKSFADFAKEIPGVGRALDLLKNPAAQLAAVLTTIAAGVRRAIAEFAQAETQAARLDAALARNGLLTDEYRRHLHDLAGEMQKTTGIADDEWLEALRKLTQFGANPGNIDALAKGVENLAGVMDGDLAGAAQLLGKAIQGNTEAFGRLGIEIEKTGDPLKDLEALLKKIAELGEGQLKAANETMAGQFKTLKNAAGDFFEGLGGLIARTGLVQYVTYGFSESLDWLAKKITPTIPALAGLKNKAGEAGESLAEARDGAREFAANLGEIRTEAEAVAKVLDAALKAKKALFDEHNERDDAAEELALAQLDRDVAAKRLTEPDARVRRAGIRQFYAGRRHERAQDVLRSEIEMIDERDRAAEGEIGEITGRIGEAQATSRNATQLEAKRRRAQELKAEMLEAMRDEERNAHGWVYGQGAVPDDLATARVEGRRKRYFDAATELSVIAAGMPRNVPFTTTAQAREEAVTQAGVPRIAELTGARTDLAARRDALTRQMETGNIRFHLGRQTAVTQLEAAAFQDLNQAREQMAGGIVNSARGGGGNAGLRQAEAELRQIGNSISGIPDSLLRAINEVARQAQAAERRAAQVENAVKVGRDGR